MPFRAYVNAAGTVSTENMPPEYQGKPGEVLFADAPTGEEIAEQFPAALLKTVRDHARAYISSAAEAARLQFVTPGSAKAMAYQEKAREAEAFLADPDPTAQKYPLIYAEVGATAPDAAGVAAVVNAKYQAFKAIEAQIGGTEAAAQKAIDDATTVAAIEAIRDGLTWPAPQA